MKITQKQQTVLHWLGELHKPGESIGHAQLFDSLEAAHVRSETSKAQMVMRLIDAGHLELTLPKRTTI